MNEEQALNITANAIESIGVVAKDRKGNPLRVGDKVEFLYKGIARLDAEGNEIDIKQRQVGTVIAGEPRIKWRGGSCTLEDYTKDIEKV